MRAAQMGEQTVDKKVMLMGCLLAVSLAELSVDERVKMMGCLLGVSSDEKNLMAVRLAEVTMWEVVTAG